MLDLGFATGYDQLRNSVSTYNTVTMPLKCPRCGQSAAMTVDLYFGFRNLLEYQLGDRVEWIERRQPQNGGRPEGGNLDGVGYTECPPCQKDFHLTANVRADILQAVVPNLNIAPYIPDAPNERHD